MGFLAIGLVALFILVVGTVRRPATGGKRPGED